MFKVTVRFMACAAIALSLGACKSNKKVEDKGTEDLAGPVQSAPLIDSTTPMSFEASGSDSGKIGGLETVFFDYDKSALSPSSKKVIAANVQWMKSAGAKTNLQIEGHCDSRGSIEYNLSLGERRAQSVKAYMVSLGIPSARLSVISFGKEKPLVSGDSEESFSKNRRANFVPLNQ